MNRGGNVVKCNRENENRFTPFPCHEGNTKKPCKSPCELEIETFSVFFTRLFGKSSKEFKRVQALKPQEFKQFSIPLVNSCGKRASYHPNVFCLETKAAFHFYLVAQFFVMIFHP